MSGLIAASVPAAFAAEMVSFLDPGRSDGLPLEEIVAHHVAARGGRSSLDAIESVRTRVRITEPDFTVLADYRAVRDGRMRVDIYAGDVRVFSEGLDEGGAWQRGRGEAADVQPVSTAGAAALRRGIEFNLFGLHRFPERGHALTLVGRERIEEVNYHVVGVAFADGFETHLFINPDTWLIERQRDVRALHPDVDPELRILVSIKGGFETHCGVVWPTRTTQIDMATGEMAQETMTLEQVCNKRPDELQIPRESPP